MTMGELQRFWGEDKSQSNSFSTMKQKSVGSTVHILIISILWQEVTFYFSARCLFWQPQTFTYTLLIKILKLSKNFDSSGTKISLRQFVYTIYHQHIINIIEGYSANILQAGRDKLNVSHTSYLKTESISCWSISKHFQRKIQI